MTAHADANIVGAAMFATSAALLAYSSLAIGRRFGRTLSDRFWMFLAAAVLQIGAIVVALSPLHSVTPVWLLLVQLIIALVLALTIRMPPVQRSIWPSVRALLRGSRRRVLLLFIALCLALGRVAVEMPIHTFDDRMYRASRAAYWLQHHSLLPWPTHNDRQTAFPFGAELMFFWPVLFTRSELAGRVAFFAGVVLCAIGLYAVMRRARVTRTGSLLGVLVLLATPTFVRLQDGLYPEVWLSLFALGAVYFALRAAAEPVRATRHLVWVGVFLALAVNVKTTALALAPAILVLPWLIPAGRSRLRGLLSVLGGAVAGAALSGLAFTLVNNVLQEGHPLGPPGMTAAHRAQVSPEQLRTHATRFVVGLLDFPVLPIERARRSLGDAGNHVLRALGADQPLPGEQAGSTWPGPYTFGVGPYATRFSLGGLLWLPSLVIAAVLIVRGGSSRRRLSILLLFAVSALAPSVLMIRWMGGMDRFFLPAYALSLPILAIVIQHAVRRVSWVAPIVVVLVALTVLPVLLRENDEAWRRSPMTERELDEPFHSALRQMASYSGVLLVAELDVRDYGLFRPRDGFTNYVVPWGHEPFDAVRMQQLLDENDVTYVLVQRAGDLSLHWRPPVDTRPMLRWLAENPAFEELPEPSPGMRLFARRNSALSAPAAVPPPAGAATMP
jgi:hypothetical protein